MAQTLDVFPAVLTRNDTTVKGVRVMVREGTAYLFTEQKGKVVLSAMTPVVSFSKPAGTKFEILTEEGLWTVTMGGGCGCGSKLKGFSFKAVVGAGVQP